MAKQLEIVYQLQNATITANGVNNKVILVHSLL